MEGNEQKITILEKLEDDVGDIRNIVQLLGMSLCNNEDDIHIIRTISVIDKMIEAVLKEDITGLKKVIQ